MSLFTLDLPAAAGVRTARATAPAVLHRLALRRAVLLLIAFALAWFSAAARAAAPAGLQIGNQAIATYSDDSDVKRTVTSNTVLTTVQQVASVSLAANTAKTVSAGGQVYYPHTLVNSGNGADTFTLSSSNSGSFAFASVLFYADANGDGVPDNAVPITTTGTLAMGQTFKFVAAGIVPPTAVAGNTNDLVITATTGFTPAATATVTDRTTVTGQAVINTTQSLDLTRGPSPSTGRTITITYSNTGNTTATNLLLTESLPVGMTYVAGSARWSVTGGTTLTDADAADNQGGIVYDYGISTSGRVTAKIDSVAPGVTGTVSFKVDIAPGLAAGANGATATYAQYGYHDGAQPVSPIRTNTVQYTVDTTAGVTLVGATAASASQGGTVSFTDVLTNTGNTTDSFDLTVASSTFPAGTTFQFFAPGGVTPLLDSNGNQTPDSGPMAPGAVMNVVVKAVLPPGATGGPYTVTVKAVSKADTAVQATAVNTLTAVAGSTVDLTNDSAGGSGVGAGPEVNPAAQLNAAPGSTVRFTLVAANGSAVADGYKLTASIDPTFAATTLPAGWTVVFKNAAGAVVDGTGTIAAGQSRPVFADVTVPAGALPGPIQLYFRALSPTTGAGDILHDAVNVGLLRDLELTPNRTGQASAAGTAVYVHTLVNNGTTVEGDGSASTVLLSTTNSIPGYTSVVYWDKNNDGTLDPSDPIVTNLSALTGGTNGASTAAGLNPGESVRLFVKVTTPPGAVTGASNTTTLVATTTGTIDSVAAPAAVSATGATTVVAAHLTLIVKQAADADCDGTAEGTFTVQPLTGGAPNSCVRYEVTATNDGPVDVTNVVVSNTTPVYTTYSSTGAASATMGSVSAPANGATGLVTTTVPTLASGQSVVLRFGVRIAN